MLKPRPNKNEKLQQKYNYETIKNNIRHVNAISDFMIDCNRPIQMQCTFDKKDFSFVES